MVWRIHDVYKSRLVKGEIVMKVTLRKKAFLRRKGKRFMSEGVVYVYGSKLFRHQFAKRVNWNKYERLWWIHET